MKAFLFRFLGCIWAIFTLGVIENGVEGMNMGYFLLAAMYGSAAIQNFKWADKYEA